MTDLLSATVTLRMADGTERVIQFINDPDHPLEADATIARGRRHQDDPYRHPTASISLKGRIQ
jgi:hypothetical protein